MTDSLSKTNANFERIKHVENGVEFWSARELSPLLEYTRWENFEKVVYKGKTACRQSGGNVADHFRDVTKMVLTGSGTERAISDFALSRYACYLIAQNGDSGKAAIAQAQTYFASQTRKQEVHDEHKRELERVTARHKLRETEKRFSGVVMDRSVDQSGIAEIRGAGDQALFGGHNTANMKQKLGIKPTQPLADYVPTITLKAKDLAAEMTTVNTLEKDLNGKNPIKQEHIDNNQAVRRALGERGIKPENLPAAEDVKRVERRVESQAKHLNDNTNM